MREEEKIFLLVLAVYVVQAVMGGLVARRRGKSFLLWFAVCFFIIPPMGWIWMLTKTRDEFMP
jgi:hypothetical protein